MRLSVIIPAYNEERRLPATLKDVGNYLQRQDYDYEIIVVNDGSKDKTAEIVRTFEQDIKNLRLIDNKENHGKGWVVRRGMLEAKGDFRLFMDADNSITINQIEKIWPYFSQGYDIVIGSRDVAGAVLDPPQPWFRIMVGNVFNLMTQILAGLWGIWDTQCGFKALAAKAASDILPKCRIDRWAFDPEILKIGKKMGYKIKEIPVTWKNDPESKVKLKGMIRMAFDLLKIRWNLISGRYK